MQSKIKLRVKSGKTKKNKKAGGGLLGVSSVVKKTEKAGGGLLGVSSVVKKK
jgi:hypothetical protein